MTDNSRFGYMNFNGIYSLKETKKNEISSLATASKDESGKINIIMNGEIVAAVEEERFSRIKHDKGFPSRSINYCLEEANITLEQVDYIGFYDKPHTSYFVWA